MKHPTVSKRNPTVQKVVVQNLWDAPEENNAPLSKVGRIEAQRVLKALPVQGPTKNRYCSALSAIYGHAQLNLHWEGENPAIGWKKRAENDCSQTALSEDDVQRLLAASLVCSRPKMFADRPFCLDKKFKETVDQAVQITLTLLQVLEAHEAGLAALLAVLHVGQRQKLG